jgi:hypothetical protein
MQLVTFEIVSFYISQQGPPSVPCYQSWCRAWVLELKLLFGKTRMEARKINRASLLTVWITELQITDMLLVSDY